MKYINCKLYGKIETLECIDRNDFNTNKEYKNEIKNLLYNYRLMGYPVYLSQRPTKDY